MTTRHEFLARLHALLKPRGYLEVGVHAGDSLRLATCPAVGIDPAPLLQGHWENTLVARMTSDNYFEAGPPTLAYVDLAFIDGMHLFEFALRDFMNIEKYANPRTVVVLDDVLPRNWNEASRTQCPGDWTGDVWKVPRLLQLHRPDLTVMLVDTSPTGTAVVFNLNPSSTRLPDLYLGIMSMGLDAWEDVPEEVLSRDEAVHPAYALKVVAAYQLALKLKEH